MGVNRLLLIEFIYSCYKFTEYTYIYEVVGIFILLFDLYELRLLQFFDMLRDGRLGIIEFGDDILVADELTGRIAFHDKTKNPDPDRMGQCVRNICNK